MKLLLLVCLIAFVSCTPKVQKMTALEAYGQIRNDFAVIIDAREVTNGEVAEPAKWIAKSKILANDSQWSSFATNHPKSKLIIFYCDNSNDCDELSMNIAKQGYTTGHFGTFAEWKKANLPVKKI